MIINRSDGFIKLHKRILNSSLQHDNNAFIVFVTLLLMAHHKDNQGSIRLNKKQVSVNRGQLVISRNELARYLNMKPSTIRNTLGRLQVDNRVDIQSDKHNSLITICKWEEYQGREDKAEDIKRTTGGQLEDNTPLSQKNKERRIKKKTYSDFEYLEPELTEFVKMRKLIKKPMTDEAIKRLVARLTKLHPDNPDKQKASLLRSVDRGWQTVYPYEEDVVAGGKHAWF